MKKYIQEFMAAADRYISCEMKKASIGEKEEYLAEFTQKLTFYMHERLIHLIVTVLFALMEILAVTSFAVKPNNTSLVLGLMFLILLVPYVMHYYFLENSVQEMYKMRDKIVESINRDKKSSKVKDTIEDSDNFESIEI